MAFGLGFNKTKVLSAAEKYVQQGKLPNAIAEYEKILKHDPKDLTVLNTVGDLYARLGQTDEACACFKSVGDAYAQQGFTVKAIAMYKKLTKLKSSLEGVLKLAELYTQQGLFNDARQQYLQVAEEFLRAGELDQAVRIFQKTLEMDPENVAMKVRLAEVYVRLGKKNEAWQIFSSAAEQLRSRGQLAPAEDILQRMLTLDPKNAHALMLRGRNALEAGDSANAIHYLQQVPDIDAQPDALKALFQAYLAADRLSDAGVLATKLLTGHNDIEGIAGFVAALIKGGLFQDALHVYHQYFERLLAADQGKTLENLHSIIGHVRDEPENLEILMELFQKAGESTHISEITELLAHAYTKKGDLERARELYQELTQTEPENPIHSQNLQQVSVKLGDAPRSQTITVEEGAVIVDELEATAPSIEETYPEELGAEIRSALTDCELFNSYNMPAKALVPLEAVLPKAPEDARLNQRLAALYTRAGRFGEAGVCCRVLEKAYSQAGYADEAGRYGELASRYEQRAGVAQAIHTEPAAAATPAPWPTAPAEFAIEHDGVEEAAAIEIVETSEVAQGKEAEVAASREIDLSEEWQVEPAEEPVEVNQATEAVESEAAPVAPAQPEPPAEDLIPETVEEVRFYLQHSMRLQALAAMAKLEALTQDEDLIGTLRAEYENTFAPAPVAQPEPAEPVAEEITIEEAPEPEPVAEVAEHAGASNGKGDIEHLVADLEAELGDGFEPAAREGEPTPAEEPAVAAAPANTGDTLGEFVADLEASLGEDFLPGVAGQPLPASQPEPAGSRMAARATHASAAAAPAVAAMPAVSHIRHETSAPAPSATAGHHAPASGPATDLSAMFAELKGELEEDTVTTAADEDPETHYNLGVAFREMGLLDEAIGELQRVCQIVDKGHPFPQLMQTYTWLAQCFLDKGVPEAAIRWYERALQIPTIDQDTRTALYYELATAHESAKNRDAALKNFLEVYGTNIDYRDVAERIKALKS
ncbi:MAG TPA: tetratricopeptide repeat protein [Terriglobales bacterium]